MKHVPFITIMAGLLLLAAGVSLFVGRFPAGPGDALLLVKRMASGLPVSADPALRALETVFLQIRLPRIFAAVLVGSALSVSGTAFQSMFINPLVSPGLLGVLSGASFGAALAMVFFDSMAAVQASAFGFGCLAVALAMVLARFNAGDRLLMLILGGIVSGAFFTALLSVVKYLADPNDQLPAIVFWLMGSLSAIRPDTVALAGIPMVMSMGVLVLLTPYLNALSMGDEEARALGVPVGLIRTVFIVCATLLSALTITMAGIIGWVGLVVPHITRMMVGPDNRILIPASALTGAVYLLVMDDLSRLVFSVEIPLGILTSLFGIPFFVLVLKNARKGWNG